VCGAREAPDAKVSKVNELIAAKTGMGHRGESATRLAWLKSGGERGPHHFLNQPTSPIRRPCLCQASSGSRVYYFITSATHHTRSATPAIGPVCRGAQQKMEKLALVSLDVDSFPPFFPLSVARTETCAEPS
jgi:hypothetical protein